MKYIYRALCFIMVLVMLSGLAVNADNIYQPANEKNNFTPQLENDSLQLSINTENGAVTLKSLSDGKSFHSNPEDISMLKGFSRTIATSQLVLSLIDKQGNQVQINSTVESVNKNGFKVTESKDRVKCVYKFPDYKISVTLYYTLKGNRLSVSIPVKEILTDKKEPYLTEIKVLPYFGAVSSDKGFIVVPDGCGSVINFGSKRSPSYSQSLYGNDRGKTLKNIGTFYQPALIPTVGFSYASYEGTAGGLLIYAESGEALATAYASAATDDGIYNTAGFGFTYRANDTVTMMDQTSKAENVVMSEKSPVSCKEFTVSYTPLGESESSLIGLAEAARERIFDGKTCEKLTEGSLPVFIKNYISVRKTKYFFGIPYKGNQSLTDIDDLFGMVDDFDDTPIIMSLLGLDKYGAVGGKIDNKLNISALGGSFSELKELMKRVEKAGGAVYPVAEFTELSKGNGSNRIKTVANLTLEHYFYNYGTLKKNDAYAPLYILKNSAIEKNVTSWIKSADKNGIDTCAPLSLSYEPYRSGSEHGGDRESTKQSFVNALEEFEKNNISLLTETSAAYSIPYSEHLQAMPISSSGFSAADNEVPFLQIVLHGIKNYSIPPINLSGDIDRYFLKCIETGSSLSFAFTASEYSYLKDSPLDFLSGAEYSNWSKKACLMAKELSQIMEGTTAAYITDYEIITDEVRAVTYDNGVKFIINYSDKTVEAYGNTVEPMSYIRMESESSDAK